jgi:hypothetical protein
MGVLAFAEMLEGKKPLSQEGKVRVAVVGAGLIGFDESIDIFIFFTPIRPAKSLEEAVCITAAVGAIGSLGKLMRRDKCFPRTLILAEENAIGEEDFTEEIADLWLLLIAVCTATILNEAMKLLALDAGGRTLAMG